MLSTSWDCNCKHAHAKQIIRGMIIDTDSPAKVLCAYCLAWWRQDTVPACAILHSWPLPAQAAYCPCRMNICLGWKMDGRPYSLKRISGSDLCCIFLGGIWQGHLTSLVHGSLHMPPFQPASPSPCSVSYVHAASWCRCITCAAGHSTRP